MLITRPFQLRSPDPAPGGGGDPAPAFTEAQTTALTELIGKTVNAAVTSHLKRQPNVAEEIKKALTKDALAPLLGELLNDLPDDDEPPAGGGNQPNQPTKPDPKITALEAQLADLKKANEAQAAEAKAAREAARDQKALADLRTALSPHVRPEALELAARDLFIAQKRVTFDEQGNPLFNVRRAPYAGAAEEDMAMTIADGVQHWLKTDEGKFFAPAPGSGGSQQHRGAPAPRGGMARGPDGLPVYDKPATTDAEKVRRAAEQAEALAAKYPHLGTL